jgi:type IV fimbrial biogenesis protein FimT
MRNKGFTLIEFAVVMAIVGILVSLATPSIINLMANADLRSNASSIVGDFGTSRAEALRTRRSVTICARASAGVCGTDWTQGWIVFQDTNNNQAIDAGERIVRQQDGVEGAVTLTGPTTFTFRSSGTVAVAGTLVLRHPKATSGRDIQVIQGGRVMSNVVDTL